MTTDEFWQQDWEKDAPYCLRMLVRVPPDDWPMVGINRSYDVHDARRDVQVAEDLFLVRGEAHLQDVAGVADRISRVLPLRRRRRHRLPLRHPLRFLIHFAEAKAKLQPGLQRPALPVLA